MRVELNRCDSYLNAHKNVHYLISDGLQQISADWYLGGHAKAVCCVVSGRSEAISWQLYYNI